RSASSSVDCVYVVVSTRNGRPAAQWRRRASCRERRPVRRMKAITTSMRSADAISASTYCPILSSPGAFVSSVVSSKGVRGDSTRYQPTQDEPESPHDALFKTTFTRPEHAAGELQTVLPQELVARINFSTLEVRSGSYVDRQLKRRE